MPDHLATREARPTSTRERVGTPEEELRLLLLEDSATDAELVATELRRARLRFTSKRVEDRGGFLQALDHFRPHLILADYLLPQFSALEALRLLRERDARIPFILVTGTQTEEIAVACMRAGADDYILKDSLARLSTSVSQALRMMEIERGREHAVAELRRSEELYRLLAENSRDLVCLLDRKGTVLYVSPSCRELLGVEPETLVGTAARRSPGGDPETTLAATLREVLAAANLEGPIQLQCRNATGEWRTFEAVGGWVRDGGRPPRSAVVVLRDLTDRCRAEDQLRHANLELARREQEVRRALASLETSHHEVRQAQLQLIQAAKMESVGRLAAGVAHEVKNPLTTLLLGVEYLQGHLGAADGELAGVLQDMEDAVKRANRVVLGLLDFSAPGRLELCEAHLNDVIEESLTLVKHECNKARTSIVLDLARDLPALLLDRNKLEHVFVNLFLNAAQAMPDGGTLTVRTGREGRAAGEPEGSDRDERPRDGTAVVAVVEDTGPGIPSENLSRIFDPFFTTKKTARATGLGLAVVKKIVDMHAGTITVTNRPCGGARVVLTFGIDASRGADAGGSRPAGGD